MNVFSLRQIALTALITAVSCVSASFASRKEMRANEMVLDNITKYYQNITPVRILNVIPPMSEEEEIPEAFGEEEYGMELIKDELWNFSPHFLFEEYWFNRKVHEIIFSAFPRGHVLDNPTTPDYVALMALKLVIDESDETLIISRAVVSFLFELVFGPDAHVPENEKYHWRYFFGDKIQSYDLPITRGFYYNYLRDSNVTTEAESWINYFDFLSRKPSVEEHRDYNQLNFLSQGPLYEENFCPVQRTLYEKRLSSPLENARQDPSLLYAFLDRITVVGPNAPASLLHRIPESCHDKVKLWAAYRKSYFNTWIWPAIQKRFNLLEADAGLTFMLSRDYLNHFDIDEFNLIVGDCSDASIKRYVSTVRESNLKFTVKFDSIAKMYAAFKHRRL